MGRPGDIEYLLSLRDRVDDSRSSVTGPATWYERQSFGAAPGVDGFAGSFIRFIEEIQERGWLVKELPRGCVARTDVGGVGLSER